MKRITALVISVMILCVSVLSAGAVNYGCDISTVSDAIYLENLNNGAVVYEKNADQRQYPASTTKIMTFIITAENVSNWDETLVTITQNALEGLDPDSTVMGLSEHIGEQVSVRDLLYGLMLPSGNDAALALAEHVGGSIAAFAEKMNAKAAELGCTGTHFANPHGLFDADHYSTARDMALIAKHAMTIPGFMEICNTVYYTPDGFDTLHNTNYMLDEEEEGGVYYYPYTQGIKTGYLEEAGKCLVTSADKDGARYLCVCLGAAFTFEENVNYAMKDSANLYDWAFENLGEQTLFSPTDSLASADVKYVRGGKKLSAVPEKAITAYLPNDYDKSLLNTEVTCVNQVEAPVKKGDVLGTLSVKYDDLDLGTVNLLAAEDVERTVSPFEAFITDNIVLVIAAAVVLLAVIVILVLMIRKRGKAQTHKH